MLPLQFFSQNLHFAISLTAALVFFAMFWLYLDAWSTRKAYKELLKWLGCLLLSIAYLVTGIVIDASVNQLIFGSWTIGAVLFLKTAGYALLIYGQVIDPLQSAPHTTGIQPKEDSPQTNKGLPAAFVGVGMTLKVLPAIGAIITAYLYWRRATKGLERHLKPVAIGFGLIALSHLLEISSIARSSTDPVIYRLVDDYGLLWWLEHLLLLAGTLVLGRWVWRYLVKRIFSQVFMVFTAMTVAMLLITTISFSFLLVRSVQSDTLNNLESAANTLKYAIDGKKLETMSHAEVIAQNKEVTQAVVNKDHDSLVQLTSEYLKTKKLSSLIITSSAGQVLLRAEDPSRWGDSLSDDPLIQRAANGLSTSSVTGREEVLSPLLYFYSSVPIKNTDGQIVGVILSGLVADTAFVDGIKQATGVDVSVYSGDIRSTTTLTAPDGKSRLIGIKEYNGEVRDQVIEKGEVFKGIISLQNQSYLAVYAPLQNHSSVTQGMLLVARPHTYILETASRSLQLTFLITSVMIFASIIPVYLIAKHITNQVSRRAD